MSSSPTMPSKLYVVTSLGNQELRMVVLDVTDQDVLYAGTDQTQAQDALMQFPGTSGGGSDSPPIGPAPAPTIPPATAATSSAAAGRGGRK
jgi:hypothetical protein